MKKINGYEIEILKNGMEFSTESLKKFIAQPQTGSNNFIEFANRELERSNLAPSSIKTNKATLNHFKPFPAQLKNSPSKKVDL